MKVHSLKCPNCAAPLEINSSLLEATCNYCGCEFLVGNISERVSVIIDNARQVGHDLEHGRFDAYGEINQSLASKVKKLIQPAAELSNIEAEIGSLRKQLNELQDKEDTLLLNAVKVKPYILPALIVVISVLSMTHGSKKFSDCFPWLCFATAWVVLSIVIRRIRILVLRMRRSSIEKRHYDKKSKVDNIYFSFDFDIIPENYRSEEMVRFIYNALQNQRAMTIQQAINLYEDDQHKSQMEALLREQIDLQKQQLERLQEDDYENSGNDNDGPSLGKTLLVGGAIIAGLALLDKLGGSEYDHD